MTRKQKKQARKQHLKKTKAQRKVAMEINLIAKNYSKACSMLPRRPHDQDKFVEDKRLGCFVSAGSEPKVWCDECHARSYCEKEVKWIVTNGKKEARWK